MAALRQHEALVESEAAARKEASRRPDLKHPTGRLNQIGRHVYAYTGVIEATGSGTYTPHLIFTTTSNYLKVRVMIQYGEPASDNLEWQILLNNIVIANANSQITSSANTMPDFIDLIIPPFTTFTWQITNSSGSTGRDVTCTLAGESYE